MYILYSSKLEKCENVKLDSWKSIFGLEYYEDSVTHFKTFSLMGEILHCFKMRIILNYMYESITAKNQFWLLKCNV